SFTAPSPTRLSPLSLHDALPISERPRRRAIDFTPLAQAPRLWLLAYWHHRPAHANLCARPGAVCHAIQALLDLESDQASSRLVRSEEHTSELQSPYDLVCRLLLE